MSGKGYAELPPPALDVIGDDLMTVPEPPSIVSAVTGTLMLLGYARRRRVRGEG
jgi:hypothetical protein